MATTTTTTTTAARNNQQAATTALITLRSSLASVRLSSLSNYGVKNNTAALSPMFWFRQDSDKADEGINRWKLKKEK